MGNVIESKINGNSKKLLKTLLLSPIERDCFEFRRVLKSMNIDENILIEIFFTRSNRQIKTVANNYSKCKSNISFRTWLFSFIMTLHMLSI